MLQLRLPGGAALLAEAEVLGGAASHRYSLALLALLSCAPGHSLSRGKLVGLLWPGWREETSETAARWWERRAREDPYDSRVVPRLREDLEEVVNRVGALSS